ncbi:MAG TPA: CRTAC1 family protein [Blastocatellia bacterium]|nr:CRTAC1 family protein [Blastocatellia bacterium]
MLLLLPAFSQTKPLPPTAQIPKPSPHAAPNITFTEVTKAAGLGNFLAVHGTKAKDYIIEAPGAGCAFVDYDNDGWLDIYLVNGSTVEALKAAADPKSKIQNPKSALFRNNKDGTFTDVTDKAGVANERWGQGVCAGDFDNDGWTDLYVTNYGKNRLYRNNGDGTFTDIAEKAGVIIDGWSTGCAFGDYDGDGLLDLFVAGYIEFDLNNPPPPATGEYKTSANSDAPKQGGMGASLAAGANYCQYRNVRVMCGPRGLKGAGDHLFRNNGNGTFTETSVKAGVADKNGLYGFGVAWFDYNDDGKLDLLVANDSTPNYLYKNKGDGTFEEVGYLSGVAVNENGREQAHMGVAIGDYDNNGRTDIHITNFADDSNVLYHNDDGENFTDSTFQAALGEITLPYLAWGTNFFDYDHDGWLDLLVANGHIYPVVDQFEWGTSYQQRLQLFRNISTGKARKFAEVGSSAGAALYTPRCSRGSSIGDFDNDGDLDILLNNTDEPPTLLRNDGAHKAGHWLTLKLVGDVKQKCPRDAIGSVVFVTANGQRMRGEVASGRSFHSQSDLRVHFGLGAATKVDKLEVRWANGKTESYAISGVDQFITIEQGKGIIKN